MNNTNQPSLFDHHPALLEFTDRRGNSIIITSSPEHCIRTLKNGQEYRTETPHRTLQVLKAIDREHPPYVAFGNVVLTPAQAKELLVKFPQREQDDTCESYA